MWKGLREFFTYNRKQRNGILMLLGLIIVLWTGLFYDEIFYRYEAADFEEFKIAAKEWKEQDSISRYSFVEKLFIFDPNTLQDSLFTKLGLTESQARTIVNFRNKGGKFHEPDDLRNIYGIDSTWFAHARAFIRIEKTEPFKGQKKYNFRVFDPNTVSKKAMVAMGLYDWQADRIITFREKVKPYYHKNQLYKVYGLDSALVKQVLPFVEIDTSSLTETVAPIKPVLVDLNSADSSQLLKLKGIGPAFASRIISYRSSLGGFYNTSQLLEVYGMDSVRYQGFLSQLKLDSRKVKKLNINTATYEELARHPYLSYDVVRNILNFRQHARPYKNVEELKNIELIDETLFSKIANYLEVE